MPLVRYHGVVLLLSALLLAYLAATTQATATTHPIAAFVHIGTCCGAAACRVVWQCLPLTPYMHQPVPLTPYLAAPTAAVGAWFGISLWVTFVAGVLLYKHLPRHTFGEVIDRVVFVCVHERCRYLLLLRLLHT